jgi:hypothetical protein
MVNNMLTNNNIKQLKRNLSLISLGNTLIANKQFKQYQNEQSSQSTSPSNKPQYFKELYNIETVSADKVIVLAGGEQYVKEEFAEKTLKDIKDKLEGKPCIIFDNEGHTKQDLINIYLAFDNIIKTKGKHPKLEDSEVTNKDKPKLEASAGIKDAKP